VAELFQHDTQRCNCNRRLSEDLASDQAEDTGAVYGERAALGIARDSTASTTGGRTWCQVTLQW
jgi:hypothetical protein